MYTKQELLKLATKNLIVNKEVAKLAPNKTMTRRLKTNLKVNDVFWLREPARVEDVFHNGFSYEFLSDNYCDEISTPIRFDHESTRWIQHCQGIPNGCIKEMARHFYKVVSVHSERLQDISQEDILSEGLIGYAEQFYKMDCECVAGNKCQRCCDRLVEFTTLWDSTAKAPNRWEDNPMVEVVEYKELYYDTNQEVKEMKKFNRAKHLYSDEYFISENVIFEYGNMFLIVDGSRKECDISTRSINLSDMLDSNGTKIFASLSEDGKGGDVLEYATVRMGVVRYYKNQIMCGEVSFDTLKTISRSAKVTGIQE